MKNEPMETNENLILKHKRRAIIARAMMGENSNMLYDNKMRCDASYVTKLNGIPMYAVTSKEYIAMRDGGSYTSDAYYVIVDKDNYMIGGDRVAGQVMDRFRKVKMIKDGKNWKEFLGIEEHKVAKNPYDTLVAATMSRPLESEVRPLAKPDVITERVTVESLIEDSDKALEEAVSAGDQLLKDTLDEVEASVSELKPRKRNTRKRSSLFSK